HAYLEKPYFLAPDGVVAQQTYAVLRRAMEETATVAIGRVVLAQRERAVALGPRDKGMGPTPLRPPTDQRAGAEIFGEIGKGKLDPEMVELAGLIIDKRSGHFEPATFEDAWQAALRRLVEAKIRGETPALPRKRAPAPVVDLRAALRRAVKAEGAK